MHRCFELLVLRKERLFDQDTGTQKEEIERIVRQALLEASEDVYESDREIYRTFLILQMQKFLVNKELMQEICNAAAIYPEYGFSFYADAVQDPELYKALQPYVKEDNLTEYPLWVNGTADLVIVHGDGSVKIIDYKSNDPGDLKEDEFAKVMEKEYAGQLELYRHAVSRLMKIPADNIETQLYLLI